jgi:flagellar motility protein MotE (MotC chaperone)
MNLRTTILLVLGMSLSFSVILVVFVLSQHQKAVPRERLPVLRAPTAEEIASSRRHRGEAVSVKKNEVVNSNNKQSNDLDNSVSDLTVTGHGDWSLDHLEPSRASTPTQVDFKAPSKHLDRMQAELMRQVQTLRQSRDLMLTELAEQFEAMTPAQVVTELAVLDNESAAIALAKLSKTKRSAVLERLGDKRARTLGRLARNYASQNREG